MFRTHLTHWLCASALLLTFDASAAPTYQLSRETGTTSVTEAQFLVETDQRLTASEVLDQFLHSRYSETLNLVSPPQMTRPFWMGFNIENGETDEVTTYLELNAPVLNQVNLFRLEQGELVPVAEFGDTLRRAPPLLPVDPFTLKQMLLPGANYYLLRVESRGPLSLPLSFYTSDAYIERTYNKVQIAGTFRGIAIGLSIFLFVLFLQTRDIALLAFVSLIISGTMVEWFFLGTMQNLMNLPPFAQDRGPYVWALLFSTSSLWFHRVFLQLETSEPRTNRAVIWWERIYLGTAALWLLEIDSVTPVLYTTFLVSPFLIISASLQLRKGGRAAKIYLAATTFPALAILYGMFGLMLNIQQEDGFILQNIASQLAFLLFAVAIADRMKQLANEKKETETLLVKTQAETKAKGEFLAKVSHELRTPMNGVIGVAELLSDTRLDDGQRRYIEIIKNSGSSLLNIINDLLDFSKGEANEIKLEAIPTDLRMLSQQTKDILSTGLKDQSVTLQTTISPDVPEHVLGDPTRLTQILVNLVGNGIKFTHQGTINLVITRLEDGRINFAVSDTGIGIPADKLEHIFELFSQSNESITREYGGTGLGLSICKQLIELMGGEIAVRSEVGKGSTFEFSLHLPETKASATPLPTPDKSRSLKILVAEDNEVNQLVIVKLLEKHGHQVSLAANGKLALDYLEQADQDFDLVLMDCEMPEMDGFTATKMIRQWEYQEQLNPIPIVALTAHATADLEEKCRSAGMNDHLSKPIRINTLNQMLAKQHQLLG